jgi:hypothetical protein
MRLLPHKFNTYRRHKIARQKHQMTNWVAYNDRLRQLGDLAIWVNDEMLCLWAAPRRARAAQARLAAATAAKNYRRRSLKGNARVVPTFVGQVLQFQSDSILNSPNRRRSVNPDSGPWYFTVLSASWFTIHIVWHL